MRAQVVDGRSLRARGQRRARRAEILQAAQKLIGTRGYQATSIADVIDAAGISRGTFYLYFESRDALFHELIDGFIQELRKSIRQVLVEEGNLMGQMLENVRRVVNLLFDNRDLTTILLREAVGIDDHVDKKLNDFNAYVLRMVTGALCNGAKCGLTRKVNEPIVAMAIIGSIREVLYQHLVVRRDTTPDREAIAMQLLDFGYRGLQRSA